MKRWQEFLANRRRKQRVNAARAEKAPKLREFVYLDEVSVYSLLTSRQGALAAEYTDTQTRVSRGEVGANISGGIPAAKASVASKFETTNTFASQILRKSTVQAAFKELCDGEEKRLAINLPSASSTPPSVATIEELEAQIDSARYDGWIVNPSRLSRGQLIDLDVEVNTDSTYRVASIMSAMRQIMDSGPGLFPANLKTDLRNVAGLSNIIDHLMVNLVPVRCRVLDYRVLNINGTHVLAHNRLLEQIREPLDSHDLYLVGVTEVDLFWKDLRRVLFSRSRFSVMCRLNNDGAIRMTWVPVKLINVLEDVAPNLAQQLEQLEGIMLEAGKRTRRLENERDERLRSVLLTYGIEHAKLLGVTVSSDEIVANCVAIQPDDFSLSHVTRTKAFADVADYVDSLSSNPPLEREAAAELRAALLRNAGIALDGSAVPLVEPPDSPQSEELPASWVLDTEIVAIYW